MITYLVKKGGLYLHGMSDWTSSQRRAMQFRSESEKSHEDIRKLVADVCAKRKGRSVRLTPRGHVYGFEVQVAATSARTDVINAICAIKNIQYITVPWDDFPPPFPWKREVYLYRNSYNAMMETRKAILGINGIIRCEITPLPKILPSSDDLLAAGGMPSTR